MKTFNCLAISDVHLGHAKTETKHIIDNLRKVITPELMADLDMIIIAGDLFDHALDYSSEEVIEIQQWIVYLLSQCHTYKVDLRILEGTPLHDRKQGRNVEAIYRSLKLDIDFLYVDKVYIEKNQKHSLNILYVPDEWNPDPDQTWLDVMEELSLANLKSVDLSIMHGMFEHQVPPNCPFKPHTNARYENITDRYVFIGHIHQPTFYGKILAPGSFDRLSHGDEGNKGCWYVKLSPSGKSDKIKFIENEGAKVYQTIDCGNLNFDSAIEKISSFNIIPNSHLRLRMTTDDNTTAVLTWCKKHFYNYHWTLTTDRSNLHSKKSIPMTHKYKDAININANSINSLITKKMKENNESEATIVNALKIMEGLN